MRAWQVQRHGFPSEVLQLVDIDEPEPGPGEVRLRVRTAALGMPDAFMCQNTYALTPPVPFVPGQEVCGIVDAAGPGVDLAVGTRVMSVTKFTHGHGGFADATIALAGNAYRVPDAMSDVDAAGFRIGYSTAWIGLVRRGALQAGERLLVLGAAGGSGATALQVGRALGARVIAVVAGPEKAAACERLGADVIIDRKTESVPDAVMAATGGHGADVVYDPVGGDAAQGALRCMASGGRLLAVGFASGKWVEVDTVNAVRRNYSLVGVFAGGFTPEQNFDDHEALLALAADGRLVSFTHAVPFLDLPVALDDVANGNTIGKTILEVSG